MQRRKLVGWLRQHDARFVRAGREHDWWHGPAGGQAAVPRHREVNTHTARAICRQLGVPLPPGR